MPRPNPRLRASPLAFKCLVSIVALSLLTGCVYLRLLKFKNQLKDFDSYMQVDRSGGLALGIKEPLLRADDFVFLTESQPTQKAAAPSSELAIEDWTWRFEKELNDETDEPFAIYFITRFENRLLTRIEFDHRLIAALPAEFVVELFKSMGQAKISKLRRSATASIDAEMVPHATLPSLESIRAAMGEPTSREGGEGPSIWRYTFNFLNPENQETAGQFKLAFKSAEGDLAQPISGFEVSGKAK